MTNPEEVKQAMLITYVVALHLLLGMILWKSDFIPLVKSRITGKNQKPELSRHFHDMRSYHWRSVELVPQGSVFFLGDSIIQGLCVDAVVQPSVNYGIGGDTTVGVLERMGDYAFERASAVVLCIGGNDLEYREPEAVLTNLKTIIDRINPSLPVVISSIPLEDESLRPPSRRYNTKILKLNALLEQLTKESSRLFFVDHANLTQSGQLRRELHVGDGMHLNNDGNRILASNLRKVLVSAISTDVSSKSIHSPHPLDSGFSSRSIK